MIFRKLASSSMTDEEDLAVESDRRKIIRITRKIIGLNDSI